MKELLKSYGAIETDNRDESNAMVTGMYGSIACFFIQVYTSAQKKNLQIYSVSCFITGVDVLYAYYLLEKHYLFLEIGISEFGFIYIPYNPVGLELYGEMEPI